MSGNAIPMHGTGRVPSSSPTRLAKIEIIERREQAKFAKIQVSHSTLSNDERLPPPPPSPSSPPRTQSVKIHNKKQAKDKPKLKVYGEDVELQHIDAKYMAARKNKGNTKFTVIQCERKYDDDDDFLCCNCFDYFKSLLEDGPIKFRYVIVAVALFTMVTSVIDYDLMRGQRNYYGYNRGNNVSPFVSLITSYVLIFGLFIISLEMYPFRMGMSVFHRTILQHVNVFRFT